jgi:hypothetical protein
MVMKDKFGRGKTSAKKGLQTEQPLSEKDEVKKAEDRTRAHQSKSKK